MKYIATLLLILSFNVFSFTGEFVIPTQDRELEYFSKFFIEDIEISPDSLRLKLPADLASAEAYEIKFERNTNGANVLNSFFGSAHCLQQSETIIKCKIKFNTLLKNVLIKNLWKTMDYIQDSSNSIADLTNRLIVAERFAGSPRGTLLIQIPAVK